MLLFALLPGLLASLLTKDAAALGIPVVHGAVQVLGPREVTVGQQPVVAMAVPDRQAVIHLECPIDGKAMAWTSATLEAGSPFEVSLPVVPPTSALSCLLVANFANGLSERRPLELSWTWLQPPPPPEEEAPDPAASTSTEELYAPTEPTAAPPSAPPEQR